MVLEYIGVGLTVLAAAAIVVVGVGYLLASEVSAALFGLSDWPRSDLTAWLNVKGVRDIVTGLAGLTLLAVAPLHVVGWYVLVAAVTPLSDAVIVLRHRGSKRLAYGMHAATAAVMVVIAALLLLG